MLSSKTEKTIIGVLECPTGNVVRTMGSHFVVQKATVFAYGLHPSAKFWGYGISWLKV